MSRLTTALLATVLVVGAATGAVATGAVSMPGSAAGEPTLTEFDANAPSCTDEQSLDSATEVVANDGNRTVIQVANASLPHPGHDLNATVERTGESRYALNITSSEDEGTAAQCLATARYVAEVRLPADGPFTLTVNHDGEQVAVVTERGAATNAAAGG